jgi:hypothetical protein
MSGRKIWNVNCHDVGSFNQRIKIAADLKSKLIDDVLEELLAAYRKKVR